MAEFWQDLYYEFKKSHKHHHKEMAQKFEDLTEEYLAVLMKLKDKLTEDHCQKLEIMLKEECNTWRLARALFEDQSSTETCADILENSDKMDDSDNCGVETLSLHNGHHHHLNHNNHSSSPHEDRLVSMDFGLSEEQIIAKLYMTNGEIIRMQAVIDWLEANEVGDFNNRDEMDKVEFYSEGPVAWENTFHAMRAKYNIDIPDLDITMNPNAGVELCSAMDPDAPLRTKKSLVHKDKEVEIRLFKHLFRLLRAGKLGEGQELANKIGYHWLAAILDGWLPYSDPNLDQGSLDKAPLSIVSGNKKRDIWKQTCFKSAKIHGLTSYEKAIFGVYGGNLKSVLPVCNTWSDQLWARLKCSIEVRIKEALRDSSIAAQENRNLCEYPSEFYDNYQDIRSIFQSIKELKIVSPFKEATIHQTVQKHFILNDINGLLEQLQEWCSALEYDNDLIENNAAVSPQFLRFFAHVVLFLRGLKLVDADDTRGTNIIESYVSFLAQQELIKSVAYYTSFLPKHNQIASYAELLAAIDDEEERKYCLEIANKYKLDLDEITQTAVELIRDEPAPNISVNASMYESESTKTTISDKRKIAALDYLLYLEFPNYVAILHHVNVLLRLFALQKKLDAVKQTFDKLPNKFSESVENQWREHTNGDITTSLRNNIRELDGFSVMLAVQEKLTIWSECHYKKPEEPKKPANFSKFYDNVNYEQRLKQYQHEISIWDLERETRTNALTGQIIEMLCYFKGGWMIDLPSDEGSNEERLKQMRELRKIYVPHMTTICFNVLQLTKRYEDCLKVSHLLARDDLKLYEEFTKTQLREFLDKISEVTKIIVRKSVTES